MSDGLGKVLDLAKGLLGSDDAVDKVTDAVSGATDSVKDGGNDLMGMAAGLLGDLSDSDAGLLDIAKDVLGNLGGSGGATGTAGIMDALKDGKLDINDLLTLGSIISKFTK